MRGLQAKRMDVRDHNEQPRQLLAGLEEAEFTCQLDRIRIVGRPLAIPIIFAFDACACRMNDERSGVANG